MCVVLILIDQMISNMISWTKIVYGKYVDSKLDVLNKKKKKICYCVLYLEDDPLKLYFISKL